MATSEQSHGALLGRVTARRIESVPESATVRHVDQLSDDALEAFLEIVSGNQPRHGTDVGLERGEVVVFTDYYRIERR